MKPLVVCATLCILLATTAISEGFLVLWTGHPAYHGRVNAVAVSIPAVPRTASSSCCTSGSWSQHEVPSGLLLDNTINEAASSRSAAGHNQQQSSHSHSPAGYGAGGGRWCGVIFTHRCCFIRKAKDAAEQQLAAGGSSSASGTWLLTTARKATAVTLSCSRVHSTAIVAAVSAAGPAKQQESSTRSAPVSIATTASAAGGTTHAVVTQDGGNTGSSSSSSSSSIRSRNSSSSSGGGGDGDGRSSANASSSNSHSENGREGSSSHRGTAAATQHWGSSHWVAEAHSIRASTAAASRAPGDLTMTRVRPHGTDAAAVVSTAPVDNSIVRAATAVHSTNSTCGGMRPCRGSSSSSSSSSSSGATAAVRRLLQAGSASCRVGCKPSGCVPLGSSGGFMCNDCRNNLVASRVTGLCSCPPGRYLGGPETCADCPRGGYCVGGAYDPASLQPAMAVCPEFMTTLGQRSTSWRACVNVPGYYFVYDADGNPGARRCPPDTYSSGYRKQRACVPCPTGFTTNGLDGQTSPLACGVPPGYYLKAPGQAAPCGQGTYKNSTVPAVPCTACPPGSSTLREGAPSADACTVLQAGSYARMMENGAIRDAQPCPQGFWCPGGVPQSGFDTSDPNAALDPNEPTIKACPDGSWTQALGAFAPEQCMTPPGFKTSGGITQPCEPSSFRGGWARPGSAAECTPCGEGVHIDPTERLTVYNISTGVATQITVATSAEDCYIYPGQGMYYESTTGAYRARNCDGGDEYGVPNKIYGRTVSSCRSCPLNQVTSWNATQYPHSASYYHNSSDGLGGFTSVNACVNRDGYGVLTSVSAPCAAGTYNSRDTTGPCQPCPTGTTTQGVGLGVTLADCGLLPGYGHHDGAIRPCPPGTYNDAPWTADNGTPCTACPPGTTSAQVGGTSSATCDLCAPGHGGPGCAVLCGGPGTATYQPPGRPLDSDCRQCTVQETGFSFIWQNSNDVYNVSAVSRQGAKSSTDCLAEFAQIADNAWSLSASDSAGVASSPAASFAACVQRCTAPDCMFVTYDYNTGDCSLRMLVPPVYVGPPLLGLKAVPSGDLGTNAWSRKTPRAHGISSSSSSNRQLRVQQQQQGQVAAQSIASGHYSFYQDATVGSIGTSRRPAPGAAGFKSLQDCMDACDNDSECAGFQLIMTRDAAKRPTTCVLIYGDSIPNTGKRTLIRADINRLVPPPI